ncbi:predicted protein [Botrytis cinerea T4]|uniref:Uncharacterized protein n=1 Tax=Botryotinia fuckeliana (strain T4) TaxID=999810 RepID=G2Y8J5_BOTF4|nr:predicted protein [Botrytis cinerea T4]
MKSSTHTSNIACIGRMAGALFNPGEMGAVAGWSEAQPDARDKKTWRATLGNCGIINE